MKYRVFYSNAILDLKNRHIDELVFTSSQQLNELIKFHEEYPDIFIWYVPTILSDEVFTIIEAVQGGIMIGPSDEINQRFVHMCDFLASKKFIEVPFENNEIIDKVYKK